MSAACGSGIVAFFCDANCLGHRRRRALLAATVAVIFLIGTWSGIFSFLMTHELDRAKKARGVDWSDGPKFAGLLVIFIFLGSSWAILLGYIQWLCSTFSNEPSKLGRFSGYMEALRALGLAVAFGIDSNSVPFLTEAAAYFSLTVVGLILCVFSAIKYTRDSRYGEEEDVIVPEAFERTRAWSADSEPASESEQATIKIDSY
jgi:phage shock protein PspC (stress-responsive transcriptional regulator)